MEIRQADPSAEHGQLNTADRMMLTHTLGSICTLSNAGAKQCSLLEQCCGLVQLAGGILTSMQKLALASAGLYCSRKACCSLAFTDVLSLLDSA